MKTQKINQTNMTSSKTSIEHLAKRDREGCCIFSLAKSVGMSEFDLQNQINKFNENNNITRSHAGLKSFNPKRNRKAKIQPADKQVHRHRVQKTTHKKNKST
jgi:hypothetical protein